MTQSKTPARLIVEAFGDCETLASMYCDDIVWRMNFSLPSQISGPHVGKSKVCAFNDAVFNKIYLPGEMRVSILDEVGDTGASAVRFLVHAKSRRGHQYDVEYVLFAKTRNSLVYEVIEFTDSLASAEQHKGNRVGIPPVS